jgi:plasmid replication initiation protein
MNLAEFPLTVLSTRVNASIKTLEFSDSVRGKNGELINRRWIITGADKFGLPTSSDDEILLGLLKLTVDSGFEERKVFFTRYELLKILRWTTEGRNYSRLQKALDRLSGVRIKASNAFYDNEAKSHSTKNFGILDEYEINDGRHDGLTKPSFFTWSEVIFKSFQVGNIKKIDLDFFLKLSSAVSRRLYRYLDKHFWYKSKIQINLFTLAHEKIGISRNYKYASSLRQQIDPAIQELIEAGYIATCQYLGRGKQTEVCFYARPRMGRSVSQSVDNPLKSSASTSEYSAIAPKDLSSSPPVEQCESLGQRLISRGIKPAQAEKLLENRSSSQLRKISEILNYYDTLMVERGHKVRSPVGFLFKAIQNCDQFVLPEEKEKKLKNKPDLIANKGGQVEPKRQDFREQYLIARKKEINRIRESAEKNLVSGISAEVRAALTRVQSMISSSNFEDVVRHGVDEKLAKLFKVPDYDEWLTLRQK